MNSEGHFIEPNELNNLKQQAFQDKWIGSNLSYSFDVESTVAEWVAASIDEIEKRVRIPVRLVTFAFNTIEKRMDMNSYLLPKQTGLPWLATSLGGRQLWILRVLWIFLRNVHGL